MEKELAVLMGPALKRYGAEQRKLLIGVAIGVLLAAGASRLVQSLFGLGPLDPIEFLAATALFVVMGPSRLLAARRRATAI